jgi:hypothetical protein
MINVQPIRIFLDLIAKEKWYVERISFIIYLVCSHILALTPFTEVPNKRQLNFTTLPIGTKGLPLKPRRTLENNLVKQRKKA